MLLSLLLTLVFAAGSPDDGEPVLSPLQQRAESAMQGFDQLGAEAEKRERQTLLLALADSLETAGHDVHAAHCLERAGILGYQFAEYESARRIWDRGLETARRSGDDRRIAALLNACAVIESVTGNDGRAVELQKELILKRREMDDPRGEGVSWYNLAYSYEALYRIPESIEAFRQALRLSLEADNAYAVALIRSALSNGLFGLGQYEEALALADSAVVDAERQEAPVLLATALGNRARKFHWLGRFDDALDEYGRSREMASSAGLRRVAAINSIGEARVLAARGRAGEGLDRLEAARADLEGEENAGARVAWRAARGRCLSDVRASEARDELRRALEEFASFRQELDTQLGRAEAFRIAGVAWADLAALSPPAEAWQLTEESAASLLREDMAWHPAGLGEFQAALRELGGVGVQFGAAGAERVIACVVSPDSLAVRVLPLPRDFALDVANALQFIGSPGADAIAHAVLERIGATLLEPLEIRSDRVVLVPGGFSGLPFEALVVGGEEFGRGRAITYAPSTTAFVRLQQRGPRSGDVLALADPSLPSASGPEAFAGLAALRRPLTPLPESRREVRSIPGRVRVLEGDGATLEAFVASCEGPAVVHVAAHAVVDASHPEHSALVLAGGAVLDATAIRELPLGADLVALSGCSTADGYLVAGEGTLGLTRAFLVAGARSVVASWWDVEDGAARRFMELFYEGLSAGEDRDRALQAARERMETEGYPARDRLAFALVGATGSPVEAVRGGGPRGLALWALPVALGGLVVWGLRRRRN